MAIVRHDAWVEAVVSANQDLQHAPFGGVVPEIASRNHTLQILPLVEEVFKKANLDWSQIDGVAVTNRPGLIGSLIVGVVTSKTIAQTKSIPLIGINHLEGHILAPFLKDSEYSPMEELTFPMIVLAVSGGHTSLYMVRGLGHYQILGATKDDAAGEAFDKFGKMVGLGFPGGVKVDQLATNGKTDAYVFPRGLIHEENYQMSFSGLKAAAQRVVQKMSAEELSEHLPDLCASFREAVVDALLAKLDRAVSETKIKNVVITGGVSANLRLRARANEWAKKKGVILQIPPLRYCTDNAAMIGLAGILRLNRGETSALNLGPSPASWPQDFS